VRVYAIPPLPTWRRLRDYIAAHGRGDTWLHWGGVKGFGAIVERDYYRWISGAAQAGLQVMVHVGEDGLPTLLAIYDCVRQEQHLADPRFRIEHGHDLAAALIPVMARAGVIASWQPPLLAQFDRRRPAPLNLFPCRALLAAGVPLAFGSDAQPEDPPAPLESLATALERAAPDGSRLTFDEALRAYTAGAAYAEFAEKDKGTLAPGMLADFVLFDRDFSRGPTRAIRQSRVRLTVVGGRVAYRE